MKIASTVLFILSFVGAPSLENPATSAIEVEKRIEDLLARMTLEEKLGQLQQLAGHEYGKLKPEHLTAARGGRLGSVLNVLGATNVNELQRAAVEESRLRIPLLFGYDVRHGYRTVFPIPLGEAASWDPVVAERSAAVAAAEAAAAGVKWTFAPMLDIVRDPRWGRVAEVSGEDPFLGSVMGAARVRGFQGADPSARDRVLACAVIWVGYGAAEGGRDYNTTEISEPTLRNVYFPPFHAAVKAGVATFMSAFNDLNGTPASSNRFTLTDVLRREWGYDGLVVSDWEAVAQLMNHGVAADGASAAALAMNAGVDMEMVSDLYNRHGAQLVKEGRVPMAAVDEAVRRVLRAKFRAGLFERPYVDQRLETAVLLKPEHLTAAREAAARSLVLLKNENNALPLRRDVKRIAVMGALADARKDQLGAWASQGKAEHTVTVLDALRSRLGKKTEVVSVLGCGPRDCKDEDIAEAVRAAGRADAVVFVVGEDARMSGEASSRSSLDLPGRQLELVQAVHKTGKPYVIVLMNGRPLSIGWLAENSPAILEAWHPGTQGGPAIADALFGDVNPGGKLPMTFPRTVGQVPIYYNHKNTGRPFDPKNRFTTGYIDLPNTPLFPFGHGLSYTTFTLAGLELSASSITADGRLSVRVDVENAGLREGDEVVQLYLRARASSLTRPVRELKGFERVRLGPGEKRRLSFALGRDEIGFVNASGRLVVEPGRFEVYVGTSSVGGLKAEFEVTAQ